MPEDGSGISEIPVDELLGLSEPPIPTIEREAGARILQYLDEELAVEATTPSRGNWARAMALRLGRVSNVVCAILQARHENQDIDLSPRFLLGRGRADGSQQVMLHIAEVGNGKDRELRLVEFDEDSMPYLGSVVIESTNDDLDPELIVNSGEHQGAYPVFHDRTDDQRRERWRVVDGELVRIYNDPNDPSVSRHSTIGVIDFDQGSLNYRIRNDSVESWSTFVGDPIQDRDDHLAAQFVQCYGYLMARGGLDRYTKAVDGVAKPNEYPEHGLPLKIIDRDVVNHAVAWGIGKRLAGMLRILRELTNDESVVFSSYFLFRNPPEGGQTIHPVVRVGKSTHLVTSDSDGSLAIDPRPVEYQRQSRSFQIGFGDEASHYPALSGIAKIDTDTDGEPMLYIDDDRGCLRPDYVPRVVSNAMTRISRVELNIRLSEVDNPVNQGLSLAYGMSGIRPHIPVENLRVGKVLERQQAFAAGLNRAGFRNFADILEVDYSPKDQNRDF